MGRSLRLLALLCSCPCWSRVWPEPLMPAKLFPLGHAHSGGWFQNYFVIITFYKHRSFFENRFGLSNKVNTFFFYCVAFFFLKKHWAEIQTMYLDQNQIFWDPHYLKNTEDILGHMKCYSEYLCKCLRQLPYFWWKYFIQRLLASFLWLGIISSGSLIIRRKWDACAKQALILCKYIYIDRARLLALDPGSPQRDWEAMIIGC